ncbi:hypothetical protein P9A47_gp79 [Xanthomonas phage Elanor]|uniref:Uncharacterized protein n=1 Tax=Xanthomonas phage Elanor TaxID=2939127 RepID=A0A9E7J5B7_9CAUD|nr:hypothetical protein P9A47_gp79 [Xanthomonas phage Elanor]URA07047.1 hypothetical protein Elanor_BL40079 [Xanthomonas phage Elanor]
MHDHKPMQEPTKADMKEIERNFHDLARGPSLEERLERARAGTWAKEDLEAFHREALQHAMQDFISSEANLVKSLAAQGKKDLAREIVYLRALVKTIKAATADVSAKAASSRFGHREAFMLMTYVQTNSVKPEPAKVLRIWNSRDGVTPFTVHIGGETYEHNLQSMAGPHFDLPLDQLPTHKWVTRTDAEVMTAWRRTLDKAVEQGKLDPDKAASMRDSLAAAEGWHYRIGLVNLATGRFTDEEVLGVPSDV